MFYCVRTGLCKYSQTCHFVSNFCGGNIRIFFAKMANIQNNESWKEFFEVLKSLPSLWKIKDDIFKDRDEKKKSWQILLESYQIIEPRATLEDLRKRVLNIKCCYRRELKKIQRSEKSGCGSDEVHTPSLWYFECLDFLKDHEKQAPGISTIDLSNQSVNLDDEIEPGETQSFKSKKKRKCVVQTMQERNEILRTAIDNIAQSANDIHQEDEAEIYGRSWAASFRKLSSVQQIYSKKAIEDILVLGQLNKLTLNTVSISEPSSPSMSTPFGISSCSSDETYFQKVPQPTTITSEISLPSTSFSISSERSHLKRVHNLTSAPLRISAACPESSQVKGIQYSASTPFRVSPDYPERTRFQKVYKEPIICTVKAEQLEGNVKQHSKSYESFQDVFSDSQFM